MLTHNLTLDPYTAESMQPALSFSSLEGNNMSTKPDYRFAVVATNRGGIALPNLVIQFAYTRPAALSTNGTPKKGSRTLSSISNQYDNAMTACTS
jgi:hypothetical protein